MESMVRHRPTTAHATCIFFSTESDSCESGKCANTLHAMWLPNTQQHRSRSHRRNTNDLQGCQSQALDPQPHAAKGDASDTSSKERNLDAANREGYLGSMSARLSSDHKIKALLQQEAASTKLGMPSPDCKCLYMEDKCFTIRKRCWA